MKTDGWVEDYSFRERWPHESPPSSSHLWMPGAVSKPLRWPLSGNQWFYPSCTFKLSGKLKIYWCLIFQPRGLWLNWPGVQSGYLSFQMLPLGDLGVQPRLRTTILYGMTAWSCVNQVNFFLSYSPLLGKKVNEKKPNKFLKAISQHAAQVQPRFHQYPLPPRILSN